MSVDFDLTGNNVIADSFEGAIEVANGSIALNKLVNVAAGTDGLTAGTLQATLQSLASRIQTLEDAP